MENRKFGYKENEGINFGRLGESHKMGDMDADEFVGKVKQMAKDAAQESGGLKPTLIEKKPKDPSGVEEKFKNAA